MAEVKHEMGWDQGKVFCRCGWISEPSTVQGDVPKRRDQQSQFVAHLRSVREESKQLSDNDQ